MSLPRDRRVAIVAVGTELLDGGRRDGNGDWIAARLLGRGFDVVLRISVADDPGGIVAALRAAREVAGTIVTTGGLGPTEDDRTREAVARAIDLPLVRDGSVRRRLEALFAARGRPFGEHQASQADRPSGAEWIDNPVGTAPGFDAAWLSDTRVVALPGVPSEMRAMFEATIEPTLPFFAGGVRVVRIAGRYESEVDRALVELYRRDDLDVTVLAGTGGIEVRLRRRPGRGDPPLDTLVEQVRSEFPEDVYGGAEDRLEAVVGRLLVDRSETVAVAESCTAGAVGAALTSVPGSSAWFRGGLLVYADDLKVALAGVSAREVETHGAVSAPVAEALARGARERCGADVGIGVTGVAGPGGGTEAKPVGTVFVALADAAGASARGFRFPGDRDDVRRRTVTAALDAIRRRAARRLV